MGKTELQASKEQSRVQKQKEETEPSADHQARKLQNMPSAMREQTDSVLLKQPAEVSPSMSHFRQNLKTKQQKKQTEPLIDLSAGERQKRPSAVRERTGLLLSKLQQLPSTMNLRMRS